MTFPKLSEAELEQIVSNLKANQKMICQKCGSELKASKQKNILGICSLKICKTKNMHWNGTFFAGLKISKVKCLEILERWMNRDSVSSIAFNSNISRKTISILINELSKIIVPKYNSNYSKIGGKNIIVEVDESKFGKRKYHKGHRVEGVWIFGMVERTKERRIHLIAVEDRTALTLNAELKAKVHEDSIIYSDCWKGYKDVFNIFAEHVKVNHSKYFKDPDTGVHTNTIEGNWCGIKQGIPSKNRTKEKINVFLTRFMILRNSNEHPLRALLKVLFE